MLQQKGQHISRCDSVLQKIRDGKAVSLVKSVAELDIDNLNVVTAFFKELLNSL